MKNIFNFVDSYKDILQSQLKEDKLTEPVIP